MFNKRWVTVQINLAEVAFLSNFCFSCQSEGVISFWRARAGSEIVRLARKRARFGKAGL